MQKAQKRVDEFVQDAGGRLPVGERETDTEKNEQPAHRACDPRLSAWLALEESAQPCGRDRENDHPHGTGRHERKAQRQERGCLRRRVRIDELRKEREKEQRRPWG